MKKKNIFLFALAIVLILATSISGALAYFTTFAEAKGGYVIELGNGTELVEQRFSDWTSRVFVFNSENSQPVYVRAKAFAGNEYYLSCYGDGWTRSKDGYLNYDEILYGGATTSELNVEIQNLPDEGALENIRKKRGGVHFNVVVIYETTPVLYDENGTPYADWSLRMGASE